jgi:hypothetical protein
LAAVRAGKIGAFGFLAFVENVSFLQHVSTFQGAAIIALIWGERYA